MDSRPGPPACRGRSLRRGRVWRSRGGVKSDASGANLLMCTAQSVAAKPHCVRQRLAEVEDAQRSEADQRPEDVVLRLAGELHQLGDAAASVAAGQEVRLP